MVAGRLILLASAVSAFNATEPPKSDLLCNRGKYYTCVCKTNSANFRGLYPDCYGLLNSSTSQQIAVLEFRARARRDVCIFDQDWLHNRWALREFFAERLNVFCHAHRARCQGARLNLRADSIVFLRVGCSRLEFVVLKELRRQIVSAEAVFSTSELLEVLEPWTTVFRLMLKKDAAFFAVKEFRFPKAVPQLKESMREDQLFHLLYVMTALIIVVVILIIYYSCHYPS